MPKTLFIPISSQPNVVVLCRPMIIQNINSAIDQIVKGLNLRRVISTFIDQIIILTLY